MGEVGMFLIEWYKPIHHGVEKAKLLHLRKAAKVDIAPLLLHVEHPMEMFLHVFHGFFLGLGMQNVVERVIFLLCDSKPGDVEMAVFHKIGHDITLDGTGVFLCILAVEYLYLQFEQLATHLGTGCKLIDNRLTGRKIYPIGI